MHKTYVTKLNDIDRSWWVVDAAEQPIGRLAAVVARVLQGKHKPTYTPHMDMGDHVIIINAEKAVFTGAKLSESIFWHTMYPQGLRETTRGKLMATKPERMMEQVISGMLPKNKLRAPRMKRVKIFAGESHTHAAQKPELLSISK